MVVVGDRRVGFDFLFGIDTPAGGSSRRAEATFAVCVALAVWPFFGIYGIIGASPFAVLLGMVLIALFSKPPDGRTDSGL